ncbi:hypothetical protein [Hydrogenophaga sp. 2FB]|uniref:hypothetical protein n=1 Tax=Hydrogenophaga sp. 2FB TaxID=2502187 RepID=UPI00207BB51D|nr:hypothetical protein [Hydrogenophaga sp. 2FB]
MDACDGSAWHGDLLWQTPRASEEESGSGMNGRGEPKLKGQALMWLTPAGMAGLDHTGKAGAGGEFAQQATRWPTPMVGMGDNSHGQISGDFRRNMDSILSENWPTPNAAVFEPKATPPVMEHRKATDPQIGLADVAVHCFQMNSPGLARPTPASRDHKGQDLPSRNGGASLSHATETGVFSHSSHQAQQIPGGPESSPVTPTLPRRLNPLFVEWLMGWPLQWTNAVPHASSAAATESWRSALQQHLSCLLDEQASPVERLAA